jgi:putative Mn2+ efflux pump MntP
MLGWVCVHTVLQHFQVFEQFIPWIALGLLLFIGGKMVVEGIKCDNGVCEVHKITLWGLVVQGVATSIDALSVGFTISDYDLSQAICSALIIGVVTFAICVAGLRIGRRLGTILAGKASIFGGAILIIIGLEIWVRGVFL